MTPMVYIGSPPTIYDILEGYSVLGYVVDGFVAVVTGICGTIALVSWLGRPV